MTSSHGKEQGMGWREAGKERGRRQRREHPQSPILPLGAHPLEGIRAEQCAPSEWYPKSHRRKKQITSGKVVGQGRDGERDRDRDREGWREKGRPLQRCAHKATKHLGTCRARQVEAETKLLLCFLAGGWLGVKDLNMVLFTSELSNILIGSCNPSNGK